jgi:hypothetical protein
VKKTRNPYNIYQKLVGLIQFFKDAKGVIVDQLERSSEFWVVSGERLDELEAYCLGVAIDGLELGDGG